LQAETFGGIVRVALPRMKHFRKRPCFSWVPINKLAGHVW